MTIFRLVEPAIRAELELQEYRTSGTVISPDRYYQLVLCMTGNEKQARNAQAEMLLVQMPD